MIFIVKMRYFLRTVWVRVQIFLDTEEEKKKEEWREAAKKELEEWYKHHAEAINKTKTTNR